jgi:hypothetical protein
MAQPPGMAQPLGRGRSLSAPRPLRGTQSLVGQMGWVFDRPSITAIEVCWRWIFGIPFLAVCYAQLKQILDVVPLEAAGLNGIDAQNPWVAAVQLAHAGAMYRPHVLAVLGWLAPVAGLVWVVVSGLGRSVVLRRLDSDSVLRVAFRPLQVMVLQAAWLVVLGVTWWGWFRTIGWVAATHIPANGEPDLIGFSIWLIFLSLGFFTAWALVSWPLSIAPLLMLHEKRSALSAFGESLRLGSAFTGKLVEINLVMGIVRLALIVLAMVFSAAPLPFSDELGGDALHVVWGASLVFYLVANDYFQIVRIKGLVEFWKMFRGDEPADR